MDLQQRINAFAHLGTFLNLFTSVQPTTNNATTNSATYVDGFKHQLQLASQYNGWFTKNNLHHALNAWATILTKATLTQWAEAYNFENVSPKTIAVIMAGNIPLVGFHDFLSVLLSGHKILIKQSSNDKHLLPYLAKYLETIAPQFKGRITFTEDKLEDFDAVIATGSNNTARYFEYYFKDKPSIIRKNRNSVAVLTGNETQQHLEALSEDIFRYYGLGCRNVSKLFVPEGYNFDAFFNAIYKWHPIIEDNKYANNYDYNKAVYLMSAFDILENGFLMLKNDESFASPIATLFYETYESLDMLIPYLNAQSDTIQCVVANNLKIQTVAFGKTQTPKLWEYADGVDTVDFLLKL